MAHLRRLSYLRNHAPDGNWTNVSFELDEGHNGFGKKPVDTFEAVPAVVMRNANKHYNKDEPVLQDFNMTVKRGAIYSLLGSSGCGKTTTLSIVVGARKLNSGSVYVFGYEPGVKGKAVGYMPQETSLYDDFSIAETLSYFGTLCGMDRASTVESTVFLSKLLRLPDSSQRVGTLSGGQRRRTAFAVALVHNPELLVLDEPTVGVDPLLRESIWQHLVHLSTTRGTTVLITTHYIEEAKESTMVGVMRNGRLIVEADPSMLFRRFSTTSMETVVLNLCRKHDSICSTTANALPFNFKGHGIDDESLPDSSRFIPPTEEIYTSEQILDCFMRLKALIHKNFVVLFRNLLLFVFSCIMPATIILIMCIAFKDDPKNLDFGIVNYEVPNSTVCFNITPNSDGECDIESLSCRYISYIPKGRLNLINYNTEDSAIEAVQRGSLWGYIKFPSDFSTLFYERSASGSSVDEDIFNKSQIIVRMDQTVHNIYLRVKKSLLDGFEDFVKDFLKNCGYDERQGEFPLQYDTPVLGTDDTQFIQFLAPNCSIGWLFFFPIIASSIRYINEKRQGTLERSLVAGTKTWEVMFAYACSELVVLLFQSILSLIVLTVIIGIEIKGSVPLVMILLVMSGFCGVAMGFFIGSICDEETHASLLAMALFFPNVFLSGILWPVEGMPLALQYFAWALPCTSSGESIRSIFTRGWPLTHNNVWPGYASLMGYILLFFLLTVVIQKFRTN